MTDKQQSGPDDRGSLHLCRSKISNTIASSFQAEHFFFLQCSLRRVFVPPLSFVSFALVASNQCCPVNKSQCWITLKNHAHSRGFDIERRRKCASRAGWIRRYEHTETSRLCYMSHVGHACRRGRALSCPRAPFSGPFPPVPAGTLELYQ